jgi:hypothetical protein
MDTNKNLNRRWTQILALGLDHAGDQWNAFRLGGQSTLERNLGKSAAGFGATGSIAASPTSFAPPSGNYGGQDGARGPRII